MRVRGAHLASYPEKDETHGRGWAEEGWGLIDRSLACCTEPGRGQGRSQHEYTRTPGSEITHGSRANC